MNQPRTSVPYSNAVSSFVCVWQDDYHPHVPCIPDAPGAKKTDRTFVTMSEYYAFRLRPRTNEATTIFEGGRLFQPLIVNWYAFVQQARLDFI